jgi:cellulose synthase/poly-beta-1,6-N-acetylglucosamine synthase-like glycosyltransferase
LATALNQAFRECKGEIVVKMDSDVTLAENTLTEIISHFSDARVGAVTGKVNVANQIESSEVRYRSMHETIQKAETNIDSVFMAQTFSAYRRNLMKEYKAKEYGDETIQTIHIRRQGYKVIYDPNVNSYEDYPDDDSERLRQKIRRAEGLLRVLFENARLMFNPRYGKFGMYVFPSNFFMFIISPILLAATVVLAILDLAFLSLATYLDITILVLLAIVVAGRKRRVISGPWTFLELQYAQLRALLNVTVLRKKDYKWTKIERVAA